MTAHWGVPDPAAVEGSETERWLAFRQTFKELENRIKVFASLPIRSLDRLKLQETTGRDRAVAIARACMTLARRVAAEALGSLLPGRGGDRVRHHGPSVWPMGMPQSRCSPIPALRWGFLAVLIALLAPVSGAHMNPAVTLMKAVRGTLSTSEAGAYVLAQVLGCCAGAVLAHAMFGVALLQTSTHARSGIGEYLGEFVATAGLLAIVLGNRRAQNAPWMVAAWIGGAYWFTSSTSFANPRDHGCSVFEQHLCRHPAGRCARVSCAHSSLERWLGPPLRGSFSRTAARGRPPRKPHHGMLTAFTRGTSASR
jgi:glycerol uptake facilitator-like aquaporin